MDDILTTEDLMKLFKIHHRTVLNLIKRKEIKAFKVGNNWRFLRSDIDKYISDNREKEK